MMESKAPETLYHYCSPDTFLNIVKGNSIWLSDISKSNDSQELHWIKCRCRDYIKDEWSRYISNKKEKELPSQEYLDRFERLYKELDDQCNDEKDKSWVFCLSEECDDLGQWRGYAKDGAGVSIGFRSAFFEIFNKTWMHDVRANPQSFFDRVYYTQSEEKELLYDLCGLSAINESTYIQRVLCMMSNAIQGTMFLAPFYKNNKFADEKEWRLVVSILYGKVKTGLRPDDKKNVLPPTCSMDYDYTIKNDDLVSHVNLKTELLSGFVNEIWLGPKCKWSVEETKLFLISQGWLKDVDDSSIVVNSSKVSYR